MIGSNCFLILYDNVFVFVVYKELIPSFIGTYLYPNQNNLNMKNISKKLNQFKFESKLEKTQLDLILMT